MSNSMRNFEDAVLEMFIRETEPSVKDIDRSVPDIIAEVNRHKREKRHAQKKAQKLLTANQMIQPEGTPLAIDYFAERAVCYSVNSSQLALILKTQLERGIPLPITIEKILGIDLDYSHLGAWEDTSNGKLLHKFCGLINRMQKSIKSSNLFFTM